MKPSQNQIIQTAMIDQRLPESYQGIIDDYIAPLACQIASWRTEFDRPLVVGINGAQGTGKSTLCLFLQLLLKQQGFSSLVLSIDDLYLTRKEREHLAKAVHPLLQTRGVPGTHDIALGVDTLQALVGKKPVTVPRFDKTLDDRLPLDSWLSQEEPVDIILFEGWCVAAKPVHEDSLTTAINQLERDEDPDGFWRHYLNEQLTGDYQMLFQMIDKLIMLKAPSMEAVFEWRTLQEQKLTERSEARMGNDNTRIMDKEETIRFVEHYERLTCHMLQEMPSRADILFSLSQSHAIDSTFGLDLSSGGQSSPDDC